MHTVEESSSLDRPATPPRLAPGVELLGAFEGSGYRQPHFLIRRGDGELVQVSRLVHLVASTMDGERDVAAIAARVSSEFARGVSGENVRYLVDEKLAPLGLVDLGTEAGEEPTRARPILALTVRRGLVSEPMHRRLSEAAQVFFVPAIVLGVLAAFVAVDMWLVASGPRPVLDAFATMVQSPKLLLVLTALTLASAVFHEFGHAAAARYGGATPGAMGVGVYLIWPVFFTDVTDSYRLDRRGRLRTDLGGVYFNVIFVVCTAIAYGVTGFAPLLAYVVVGQLETLRQFLPFVRLDGYYVVSDVAGVPNLFAYLGPVLTRVVRRRDPDAMRIADAKLAELNPRSRRVITTWVYVTAPILAVNVVAVLFVAPHLAGPMLVSVRGTARVLGESVGRSDVAGTLNSAVDLILLAAPLIGLTFLTSRAARTAARHYRRSAARHPKATALASVAVLATVAVQVALWWPSAMDESIERAERRAMRPEVAAAVEEQAPPSTFVAPGTTVTAPGSEDGRAVRTSTSMDGALATTSTSAATTTGPPTSGSAPGPSTVAPATTAPPSTGASPPTLPTTAPAPATTAPTTRPPATPPPITVPPVTAPPVVSVPVTLPPVTLPPVTVTVPPVLSLPVSLPPVTLPPVTLPPVTLPPVTLPPVTLPPIEIDLGLGLGL